METREIEISIGIIKVNSSYICVKRNVSPYKGFIEFPGGKRKNDESIASCLVREIKEELNISAKKYKYIGFIKHLYDDVLIKINIFKIFKYEGQMSSIENREIVLYKDGSVAKVLPTHHRILNILSTPRLLKIINIDNVLNNTILDLSIYKYLRLRSISYKEYKKFIEDKLKSLNFSGKLIIDYPYSESWIEKFYGIHYNSANIKNFNHNKANPDFIHSASCHTTSDINKCNQKIFDYILLSPLHISHNEYSALGWQKFSKLCLSSYSPTLALGGLSSHGFDYNDCIKNFGFGIAGIGNI